MKRPTEIAYEYIKEKIQSGEFFPSQKLIENDLATKIGVSRNTVKKVFLILEQEGLVETEGNKGASVRSYTLEDVINYLEIREMLEGLIIESVVKLISSEDVLLLEDIYNRMVQALDEKRFDDYSSLNKRFHQVIYSNSKNQQAVEMVNTIKVQLQRLHLRTILIPGRNENSQVEHKMILDAIKLGNTELAVSAIKMHVRNIKELISQNYSLLS